MTAFFKQEKEFSVLDFLTYASLAKSKRRVTYPRLPSPLFRRETCLLSSQLPSNCLPHSTQLILTARPPARVFKLAHGGPSVLETTLSPATRLEIDATDVAAAATVVVGRSCMQEVQGDYQAGP